MESNKLILKRAITSAKFGVIFPKDVELSFYEDQSGNVMAEHLTKPNCYVKVEKSNIKEIKK